MDYYQELQEKNDRLEELLHEAAEFVQADIEGLKRGVSRQRRPVRPER